MFDSNFIRRATCAGASIDHINAPKVRRTDGDSVLIVRVPARDESFAMSSFTYLVT